MARKSITLSPTAQRILEYLRVHKSDIAPTRQELAEHLDAQVSNVQRSLVQLVEFGYITMQPRKARTIQLTEKGRS